MIFSRRTWVRLLFEALGSQFVFTKKGAAAPWSFQVDRLRGEHPSEAQIHQYRAYRADAIVSLLSVTIFSRPGVGNGFASYRESRQGGKITTVSRFAGGSFPQRAHNLNRLGFIEEVVVTNDAGPVEAAYLGFMTSSPEEGIRDAKRSLEANRDEVSYVAAEGHISALRFLCSKARFSFPGRFTWADRSSLMREVRAGYSSRGPVLFDNAMSGHDWPGTLLGRLAWAIQKTPATFDAGYVYNAKQFRLQLERTKDPKAGAGFAARNLTRQPDSVFQYRGLIHDLKTGKFTRFKFWTGQDGAALLPLRIELQPRSFLSLAFEFDPTLQLNQERQEI